MLKRFAVMGSPVAHSLSPLIHTLFAKQTGVRLSYAKLLVSPGDFQPEVKYFFDSGGCGLNITSPLKELAYNISDVVSPRANAAKSANILWMQDDKVYADNTDGDGLVLDLLNYVELQNKKILIVGAGGAARGIISALSAENPQAISIFNRNQDKALTLQQDLPIEVSVCKNVDNLGFDIIINATPSAAEVIPDSVVQKAEFCYDLQYSYMQPTGFVRRACTLGIDACSGFGMLVQQARLGFEIWHKTQLGSSSVQSGLKSLKPK